jgi:hypothetical protein
VETHRYYRSYFEYDYYIPIDLEEEFIYYNRKISENKGIADHIELYHGSIVAFNTKFSRYRVRFRKGRIWVKKTESWMGNNEKGSEVKICYVNGSFIFYKNVRTFLGFRITVGPMYCLNKFSMLRIFEGVK